RLPHLSPPPSFPTRRSSDLIASRRPSTAPPRGPSVGRSTHSHRVGRRGGDACGGGGGGGGGSGMGWGDDIEQRVGGGGGGGGGGSGRGTPGIPSLTQLAYPL